VGCYLINAPDVAGHLQSAAHPAAVACLRWAYICKNGPAKGHCTAWVHHECITLCMVQFLGALCEG